MVMNYYMDIEFNIHHCQENIRSGSCSHANKITNTSPWCRMLSHVFDTTAIWILSVREITGTAPSIRVPWCQPESRTRLQSLQTRKRDERMLKTGVLWNWLLLLCLAHKPRTNVEKDAHHACFVPSHPSSSLKGGSVLLHCLPPPPPVWLLHPQFIIWHFFNGLVNVYPLFTEKTHNTEATVWECSCLAFFAASEEHPYQVCMLEKKVTYAQTCCFQKPLCLGISTVKFLIRTLHIRSGIWYFVAHEFSRSVRLLSEGAGIWIGEMFHPPNILD
jgi:hypothetical protein